MKILIATDGSSRATVAVRHGMELARTMGAGVHIVTAYGSRQGDADGRVNPRR